MNERKLPSAKCKRRRGKQTLFSSFVFCASYFAGGCTWDQFNLFKPPTPPPPPVESFVLRNGALQPEAKPKDKGGELELAGAREFFRHEEYEKAEKLFHHIADNEKNQVSVIQEAMYYRAECLRLQGDYPKAGDVYADLLKKFTQNPFRDLAIQHMYDIAQFWLQDTWVEMQEAKEKSEGKRWVVWPRFVSLDKRTPLLDREGRAIERLKDVYTYEGRAGVLSDKALFLCGHVNWYHEDYVSADHHFTMLHSTYPDSPFAPYAVELAIKAKLLSTGGELYDGRKVAEARKLVDDALRMPKMSDQRKREMHKLLASISAQQAEKDFQMAEFFRRTGHPGSAYFYYEIVRRRYPDPEVNSAASRALQRQLEIRAKMEKEERDRLGPPPEQDGRPVEQLASPRRVPKQAEPIPAPQPVPGGSEVAPPPRPLPAAPGAVPLPRPSEPRPSGSGYNAP